MAIEVSAAVTNNTNKVIKGNFKADSATPRDDDVSVAAGASQTFTIGDDGNLVLITQGQNPSGTIDVAATNTGTDACKVGQDGANQTLGVGQSTTITKAKQGAQVRLDLNVKTT